MLKPPIHSFALTLGLFALATAATTQAGQPLYGPTGKESKEKLVAPLEPVPGAVTLGGEFSDHLSSVFLDSLTPFWRPGNAVLFLDTRSSFNDSHQYESSYGLGLRYLVPEHDVIIGVNGFYDTLDSQFDNQFDSLGFGAEVLTHWVDARFNYYLPESDDILAGNDHRNTTRTALVGNQLFTTTRKRTFRTYESELEGWNAELGFLIPGLEHYVETRVFGGYYHYNNPGGDDYEGFKARFEAHLLPGLIADAAWWNDSYVNGGHWSAGLRAQVPFDFFNLFRGRNPFEGAGDAFRPRERDFRERLSDMVIRSHRVKTAKTKPMEVSDRTTTNLTTLP